MKKQILHVVEGTVENVYTPQNPSSTSATTDNGFSWGGNFQCYTQLHARGSHQMPNLFVIVRIGPVSTFACFKRLMVLKARLKHVVFKFHKRHKSLIRK